MCTNTLTAYGHGIHVLYGYSSCVVCLYVCTLVMMLFEFIILPACMYQCMLLVDLSMTFIARKPGASTSLFHLLWGPTSKGSPLNTLKEQLNYRWGRSYLPSSVVLGSYLHIILWSWVYGFRVQGYGSHQFPMRFLSLNFLATILNLRAE